MATEEGQRTWERVHDRVLWWINDITFKPPEVLTEHYYECMAQDIADFAVDGEDEQSTLSAMDRLDPPRSRTEVPNKVDRWPYLGDDAL